MKPKIQLIFLLCLSTQTWLDAQQKILGIGLIRPSISIEETIPFDEEASVLFKIDLYHQANFDTKSGDFLTKEVIEEDENRRFKYVTTSFVGADGDQFFLTGRNDKYNALVWTGYKSHCLEFFEEQNGFVRIAVNDKTYWIARKDMEQEEIKTIKWAKYFEETSSSSMEVLYNMNLRTAPTVSSEKVKLITINRFSNGSFHSEYHLIKSTGNIQGNWMEVEVRFWKKSDDACRSVEPISTIKGWVKYLDDKGFPNLFIIPSPCC